MYNIIRSNIGAEGLMTLSDLVEVMNRPAGISAPLFVVHRLAAGSQVPPFDLLQPPLT